MNDAEYRALVEAGPAVVMVDKEKMLKLLDERQYRRQFGRFCIWLILFLVVLRFLGDLAQSCFLGVGQ
jgi:hypothetical protein